MKYTGIEKAVFLERPNRFIAYVNGTDYLAPVRTALGK